MADYTLYCFAQSGNCYKVALMLALCDADWEPRFVDFFNGETRTPEFRAINEMGEVPVLDHGQFAAQSAIERREILRWLLFDNHKLTSYIGTLRFMVTFMKTGETPVTEFLRGRAETALGIVDGHLKDRDFILGDRSTIADLSMCGYLYWPEEFGVSWSDYPNVGGWLDRIAALPGWVHPYELMPGHPLPDKK